MKKTIVKKMGDKMIKKAEKQETIPFSCFGALFYEVERPECLKKLDKERLENSDR
ncbi:hypothetical protein SAMN04487770_11868 [Butyrivibrio sp. ob235]|uniref:hypothetical protein n=1 Tax=Butyrivibrio sp. ob235 TaxID=1761780 RepID=UPI0008D6F1EA|nr:hypothetical protein [Butyrivibrio sp. ob235]SEL83277.1 hypothetical protein SAMN04487770_11868 [Butyrivibrio sp. ob235]